ncbi:hypothetical protein C0J50_3016 [Silurus asotus]|uniref:Uncharacterized protein n=1 Tax=Silurus asotus TaxID=30991 RepID=A0AAD5FTX9_SILAS|nr:hypothetical protein C0J50_3016 [Silurus asotus]
MKKQMVEEEQDNEPSSLGDKKTRSCSSFDTKPRRQDVKSDPTPLGAISSKHMLFNLSRLER